jgi:tetratricopeptide (TPR) repeat protein
LPLRPLIDLTAAPDFPPSLVAAAALHRVAAPATGWSAAVRPAPGSRAALVRAGLVPGGDPFTAPAEVLAWVAAAADPAELLWAARLLLALGREEDGLALLRRIGDAAAPDVAGWRDLLLAGTGPVPVPPPAAGPALLLATLAYGGAVDPGAVAAADPALGPLAVAHLLARHLRTGGEIGAADVDAVLSELDDSDLGGRDAAYAVREAAARHALAAGDIDSATRHATAAIALDPGGAGAHLLAATVARAAGDFAAARRHYRSAARLGVVERADALAARVALAAQDADDPVPYLLSARADAEAWAARAPGAARPLPLERYRPFLDLTPPVGVGPADIPPVSIHTPLMSAAAVRERREPWFREIHPQRATAAMFRSELESTAALFGQPSGATSATFEVWLAAPDGCPADIRERVRGAADLPILDRALLARLISAIGFHAEAKTLVPGPDRPVRTPEEAYALASWLFAEQMLTTGHAAELDPHFRTLYAQLGDDPRYARMRVVTTINATVNAARRREPDTIRFWRAEGEPALARYVALPEVDDFSGALMTSRWFRAMGFLPFLTGDHDLLRADLDQWLGIAADLRGDDEHTRIIAADNYFPAVETAVRTHSYLGESDTALALVEKLATEIDPVDPKTWLELGELRHRAGDVPGALEAYLRAARLEFPYGRLSWFNAGQCHEQLGHADEAAECYRRSLAHWPTGLTPLRRLRDLHRAGGLGPDGDLLATWARHQPAWDKLPA